MRAFLYSGVLHIKTGASQLVGSQSELVLAQIQRLSIQ